MLRLLDSTSLVHFPKQRHLQSFMTPLFFCYTSLRVLLEFLSVISVSSLRICQVSCLHNLCFARCQSTSGSSDTGVLNSSTWNLASISHVRISSPPHYICRMRVLGKAEVVTHQSKAKSHRRRLYSSRKPDMEKTLLCGPSVYLNIAAFPTSALRWGCTRWKWIQQEVYIFAGGNYYWCIGDQRLVTTYSILPIGTNPIRRPTIMISPISPDHEGLQAMEFPSGLEIPIDNAPQIFPIYNPLYTVDAERGEQFYGERRGDSPIPEDDHESQSEGKSGKGFDIRNLYRAGIAVLFLFVAGAALVWGVGGARIQKCTTEHTRSRYEGTVALNKLILIREQSLTFLALPASHPFGLLHIYIRALAANLNLRSIPQCNSNGPGCDQSGYSSFCDFNFSYSNIGFEVSTGKENSRDSGASNIRAPHTSLPVIQCWVPVRLGAVDPIVLEGAGGLYRGGSFHLFPLSYIRAIRLHLSLWELLLPTIHALLADL